MRLPASASLAAVLLSAAVAQAASTPDTSRALKTLMSDDPSPSQSFGKSQGHSDKGTLVTVARGDTLAKILARYPELMPPTRPEIFKAVVAMNPQAFIGGNPNRLITGAQLQLPEAEELHAVASGRSAHKGGSKDSKDLHADAKSKAGQKGAGYNHREDPHAGWVRFPSR